MPWVPMLFSRSSVVPRWRASVGIRSAAGCSQISTSPVCSAAATVLASGMFSHSTRSTFTTPAGQAVGWLGAGAIGRVALIDDALARHPLLAHEAEGAGAVGAADRPASLGFRLRLGHHDRDLADGAAQRIGHQAERLLQHQRERAGIDRLHAGQHVADAAAHHVARHPAPQGLHHIGGGDLACRWWNDSPSRSVKRQVSWSGLAYQLFDDLRLRLQLRFEANRLS